MSKSHVDISIIITGHREGMIASPTLRSAIASRSYAASQGINVELLAVLDRPDPTTIDAFGAFSSQGIDVMEVEYGDPGRSRNHGVGAARGQWIAFLDGDDLFHERWPTEAYRLACADERNIVWHPEVSIYFGGRRGLFRHIDMESEEFDVIKLLVSNHWTCLCFARRELLMTCPHPETSLQSQLGYEDWAWNMQVIRFGAIHKIVPGTSHAIRVKPVSVLQQTNAVGCLPSPSGLYRDMLNNRQSKLQVAAKVA